LRPLTYGTPKPMVPLFGIPFLERTMGRLRTAGVRDVILASGYLPQAIEDHFGDGSRIGMSVTYVVEAVPLGTAGALRNVAGHIKGTFFVLNGDVLTTLDLAAMYTFHKSKGGLGTIHALKVEDPSAFGCVVRDADGRVSAFIEKPKREDAPTDEINAGTYILERRILDEIPDGRSVSIERETFPKILGAGERLYSFVTNDYWLDVGRPEQYLKAHHDILAGQLPLVASDLEAEPGQLWQTAASEHPPNVNPPVFIGADVTIDSSAIVGPFAVIGSGSTIGAHALVRDAVLWDGVQIADDAQVVDAILASNVRIGRGAIVSLGAVIGHDAEIVPGAILEPQARVTAINAETVPTAKG